MKSYQELEVWQKSMNLTTLIYQITQNFPRSEMYGLTNQMRRSAIAVPSNIAEGYGRGHRLEYIQFLRVAYGSSLELETQLILAQRIGYVSETEAQETGAFLQSVQMMLNKLMKALST